MIVVGLTGGIAMGKSTVTRMISMFGYPVFDADLEVHSLYDNEDKVYDFCLSNIPEACKMARVDRKIVSDKAFADPVLLDKITNLISYHLDINLMTWLAEMRYRRDPMPPLVVIDAPLLFEGHWHKMCDETITVECDPETQWNRAMARTPMTATKLSFIIDRQLSTEQRVAMSDHVIDSNLPIKEVSTVISRLLTDLST